MTWQRIVSALRLIGAVLPFLFACYGGFIYAQESQTERRLSAVEISSARHDERFLAIVARIDAIDKTLWWLIVATFGGTGVSGAVAADRVIHKRRTT